MKWYIPNLIGVPVMQESENLTREQIEEEIKEIKEAHAEDEGMLF